MTTIQNVMRKHKLSHFLFSNILGFLSSQITQCSKGISTPQNPPSRTPPKPIGRRYPTYYDASCGNSHDSNQEHLYHNSGSKRQSRKDMINCLLTHKNSAASRPNGFIGLFSPKQEKIL